MALFTTSIEDVLSNDSLQGVRARGESPNKVIGCEIRGGAGTLLKCRGRLVDVCDRVQCMHAHMSYTANVLEHLACACAR